MRLPRGRANAIRRGLSVMGRLALIVSLWHAPLPIVHAHGVDVADSVPFALVDHLVEFHPDVALNSDVDLGWHWHLVPPPAGYPCEKSQDGNCPFCPHDAPAATLPHVQTSMPAVQMIDVGNMFAWHLMAHVAVKSPRWNASEAPTQFLDTYLGSVSLGTLLRVARC